MPTQKRLNPMRAEEVRNRIKIIKIVDRVQAYALAQTEEEYRKHNMTQRQLSAAKLLLNKALPDLSAVRVEQSADENTFVIQQVNWTREGLSAAQKALNDAPDLEVDVDLVD